MREEFKDGYVIKHFESTTEWYKDGKRHREDGPAIEFRSGKSPLWFYKGVPYSSWEVKKLVLRKKIENILKKDP